MKSIFLLMIILLYEYVFLKIRDERSFFRKALITKEVRKKIDSGYTGHIICVDEYHLLRNNYSLRKICRALECTKNTILYKLPEGENGFEGDFSVINDLNIEISPCIVFLQEGQAVGVSLAPLDIEDREIIMEVNNYMNRLGEELGI